VNTNDLDGVAERLSQRRLDSSALLVAQAARDSATSTNRDGNAGLADHGADQGGEVSDVTRAEDLGPPLCRLPAQANTTIVQRSEEQHREH
jgi:hypothetical protein